MISLAARSFLPRAARFARIRAPLLAALTIGGLQVPAMAADQPSKAACPATSLMSSRPLAVDEAPELNAGRASLDQLRDARRAIDEHYLLSAREALIDARERLADLANSTPALVAPVDLTGPCGVALRAPPVPAGWASAAGSLESVQAQLPGLLREADPEYLQAEAGRGRTRASDETPPGRISTIALRITIFPLAPVTADVLAALSALPDDASARWHAARRAVEHALSSVETLTRLRDAPLFDAYCDTFAARKSLADDPGAARSSLRRAGARLADDPSLRELSQNLVALADSAKLAAPAIEAESRRLYARIESRLCNPNSPRL